MRCMEQLRMIQHIIRNSKGTTFICRNEGKWNQIPFDSQYVSNAIAEHRLVPYTSAETFISMQSFRLGSKKRTTAHLEELRTVYLDIDYYKVDQLRNLTPEAVAEKIMKVLRQKNVSLPSMTIDSGHGLYLIWLIDIHSAQWLPVWRFIMRQFHLCLADFGADAKSLDCSRVLRLPGTINQKENDTGVLVRGINIPQLPIEYTMRELYDQAVALKKTSINEEKIPEYTAAPEENRRSKTRLEREKNRINKASRIYQIQVDRIYDLKLLLQMRQEKAVGTRELTFFYLNISLRRAGFSDPERMQILNQANQLLPQPLPYRELSNVVKSWTAYMPSNRVIIKQLDITPEEQKHMRTIFGPKEKARRRTHQNRFQVSRQERKLQCATQIAQLMISGRTVQEIASELKLSRQTVYNYRKVYGLCDSQSARRFLSQTKAEPFKTKSRKRRKHKKEIVRLNAISATLYSISYDYYRHLKNECGQGNKSASVKKLFDVLFSQLLSIPQQMQTCVTAAIKHPSTQNAVKTLLYSHKNMPIKLPIEGIRQAEIEEVSSTSNSSCDFFYPKILL